MRRFALSLLLLGAIAPAAHAEGTRSLGVTVSPVGAYAVTRMRTGVVAGYSGSVDWDFRKPGSWMSMGGHLATSALFTEATPFRIRVGPSWRVVMPYVGFGASLLVPFEAPATAGNSVVPLDAPGLRVGGEAAIGVSVRMTPGLFVAAEGRYQNFSLSPDPLSSARQDLLSAYLGLGFRL